jgi:hypothetical protein
VEKEAETVALMRPLLGVKRTCNKALFLFDQDSFLLRALGATEYALLVTGRVGRLNAIKPHTPAAVRTQRLFSNRLLDCLR